MNLEEYRKEMDNCLLAKKSEMENCNHLFLKLEEGKYFQGFYANDRGYKPCKVECVLCGLTNKYTVEKKYYETKDGYLMSPKLFSDRIIKMYNQVFNEQFSFGYSKDKQSFDESIFNLISQEPLNTSYAVYLYQRVTNLGTDLNNQDIFEIMKILNDIKYEKLVNMSAEELSKIIVMERSKIKIKK